MYDRLGRPPIWDHRGCTDSTGTGAEAAQTPQELVVDLECRDTVQGTLEGEQMCMVDPRSVSELTCDLVRSVSDKLVRG